MGKSKMESGKWKEGKENTERMEERGKGEKRMGKKERQGVKGKGGLEMEKGNRIIARPSGTEPKIKFYFNLNGDEMPLLEDKLKRIKQELKDFQQQSG